MENDRPAHEKAIISAVNKYFDTAPSKLKSTEEDPESSIMKAFHRYFVTEDQLS